MLVLQLAGRWRHARRRWEGRGWLRCGRRRRRGWWRGRRGRRCDLNASDAWRCASNVEPPPLCRSCCCLRQPPSPLLHDMLHQLLLLHPPRPQLCGTSIRAAPSTPSTAPSSPALLSSALSSAVSVIVSVTTSPSHPPACCLLLVIVLIAPNVHVELEPRLTPAN